MRHHKGRSICPGKALAHLAAVVRREGALPVQLLVPVGKGGIHLGFGGLQALPLSHQQKPQPAAQLALRLLVQPLPELFHRLPAYRQEPVKVDAVCLQAQIELPLLGKVVARFQPLGHKAGHLIAQLPDQLLLCPVFSLCAALCVELPGHPVAQHSLACGIGGALFVTIIAVDLQLNGQPAQRVGLDSLHKAGIPSQFQRRQGVELRPRPEALGLVDRQQLKIRVGHRYNLLFLHQLPVKRIKALQNGAVHRCRQQLFLVLRGIGTSCLMQLLHSLIPYLLIPFF